MKHAITGFLLLTGVCFGTLQAQQDPLYTQYMFNALAINPAYAGTRDVLSVSLTSRMQWVGFKGAPKTQFLMAHSPIGRSNTSVGANVIHDQIGPTTQTGAYMDYAYRIRLNQGQYISFGLKAGLNHLQNDLRNLLTYSETEPYQSTIETKNLFNVGAGIYWYGSRFYAGISVPKLIENTISSSNLPEALKGKEVRHYYAMAGYLFGISSQIKIKPSLLIRLQEAVDPSADFNLSLLFYNRLWIGAMYRLSDSYGAHLKWVVTPQFYMGYAFDHNQNDLKNYHNGSHEIMVGFELNFERSNTQNPRYF